jgi:Domain of unknown function (DUF4397)
MRRARRVLGVLLTAASLSIVGMPGASAAGGSGGMLRVAHLSPDTPAVDVYVTSVSDPGLSFTVRGVDYGTVSDYRAVAPGTYAVSMRAAGDPAGTPPVLSTTVDVPRDGARTVAGLGRFADLGLAVLDDDLTTPPPGQARVRLIAAAATAGPVAASVGGTTVSPALDFAAVSGYVDVPGGSTSLQLTPAGGGPTDLPVELAAGSVYSLLVLDRSGGGLTVTTALDAASPAVVPVGGVEAGAGGTAVEHGVPVGRFALAALALAALFLTARARLARGRRPARRAAR